MTCGAGQGAEGANQGGRGSGSGTEQVGQRGSDGGRGDLAAVAGQRHDADDVALRLRIRDARHDDPAERPTDRLRADPQPGTHATGIVESDQIAELAVAVLVQEVKGAESLEPGDREEELLRVAHRSGVGEEMTLGARRLHSTLDEDQGEHDQASPARESTRTGLLSERRQARPPARHEQDRADLGDGMIPPDRSQAIERQVSPETVDHQVTEPDDRRAGRFEGIGPQAAARPGPEGDNPDHQRPGLEGRRDRLQPEVAEEERLGDPLE